MVSESQFTEESRAVSDPPGSFLEALMGEHTDAPAGRQAMADEDEVVEHLMAEFSDEEPIVGSPFEDGDDDLGERAAAAARSLVEDDDAEDDDFEQQADELLARSERGPEDPELRRARRRRQDRILIGLLLANMILMGVIMAVPGYETGRQPAAEGEPEASRTASPPEVGTVTVPAPARAPDPILPDPTLYEASQQQIAEGNYGGALQSLESYVQAHADLRGFELQLVYSSMAYCLEGLGRREEALAYGAKVEDLRQRTAPPEDLLRAGQRAEQEGRASDMRRNYARFLLQQDRAGGQRGETYRKIGDSYRIEAEQGDRR